MEYKEENNSLSNYPFEFNHFTNLMWGKIKQKEEKYKHAPNTYLDIKEHFIDEIIECFYLEGTRKIIIKNILMESYIDDKELIDVANMSFAVFKATHEV
jgi:hypothetical protein